MYRYVRSINIITEPFTAEDVETAVNDMSPCSTQSAERATTSPMTNALTSATVAAVIASVEEDTEAPVLRRTTRSRSTRLNLAATFEGFVPANNPADTWQDRDSCELVLLMPCDLQSFYVYVKL